MGTETDRPDAYTDREARCVIIAAEARGFQREPGLHARQYDSALHDDAHEAALFLRERDPDALTGARSADDPLPTWAAIERLLNEGRVSLSDVHAITKEAADRGFVIPEPDLPLVGVTAEWDQARAPLAFLWESDPDWVTGQLGEQSRLAPLPESAIDRIDVVSHRFAGPIPSEPPEESVAGWL